MTQLRFSPVDIEMLKSTAILMVGFGWEEDVISKAMASSVGLEWEDFTMPERDYALRLIRGTITI